MPPKFFITHSWKDIEFARKLCDDLHANGLAGFFDMYSVQPGDNIAARIARGLDECDVYVPILSPAALESPWCEEEINAAITLSKERERKGRPRIIPIVIAACNLPTLLKPVLNVNFVGRYDDALSELLSKGFGLTGKMPPSSRSIHTTSPQSNPPQPVSPRPEGEQNKPVEPNPMSANEPVKPSLLNTDLALASSVTHVELDELYTDALEAFHLGKWDVVAAKLREVVAIQPGYEDAAVILAQAEIALTGSLHYTNASFAITEKRWADAIRHFEFVLAIDPNYKDAAAKLAEVKRWAALPDLYKRALVAIRLQQWLDARTLLEQIQSTDAKYRETKQLLERVQVEWSRTALTITGKEMILIPAGEFVMGSNDGRDNEKPPQNVYLNAFYIARYPVTNAEYKKFVDATKHSAPSHWQNGQIPKGKENHPVVTVTWDDAITYTQWAGARLPTEAEWEKAASWDEAQKVKRVYPWGDEFDANKCNTRESGIKDTTHVGKYSPQGDSAYGVGDMVGNVWEWCSSLYQKYPYRADDGRENMRGNGLRVLRGGSWFDHYGYARGACRSYPDPGNYDIGVGFRFVVSFSLKS